MKLPTGHILDFELGDIVYLKTDPEQLERIITAFCLYPGNGVTYRLSFDTEDAWHYAIEISTEKDIVKSLNN